MSISWKVENRSVSILAIESHSAGTSKSYTLLYITRGALEDVVCQCFFSKLQLANGNGKRVAELLVSCRCVLSAVGLSMASLKRYSVEMSYVQRSQVVTPHKLLIKEKSTYPVRNPSCCRGKRLNQCALPCTVKLRVSRVDLVRTWSCLTQGTLNLSRIKKIGTNSKAISIVILLLTSLEVTTKGHFV